MDSLFVYGTLMPGGVNAHLLENIGGVWESGYVYGRLLDEGWGAGMGFPGILLEDNGSKIAGFLFYSDQLSAHWAALDEFEGGEYCRVPVRVTTNTGLVVTSFIYSVSKDVLN